MRRVIPGTILTRSLHFSSKNNFFLSLRWLQVIDFVWNYTKLGLAQN